MAAPVKIDLKKRIAEIDSIKDPMSRAEALAAVAADIAPDSPLMDHVLELVLTTDPSYGARIKAYQALLPKLPTELLLQALSMVQKQENEKVQAEELGLLAPYLPPDALSQALDMAANIQYESARGHALQGLSPHLPDSERERALSILQSFKDPTERVYATLDMLRHMKQDTGPILDDLARLSESVEDPRTRAHVFTVLAPLLDREGNHEMARDLLSRAEEIINSTEDSRLEGQLKTAWGHHYLQSEDLSAAREAFEQALEMTSEETERAAILNPLGLTLRSMGKADLALNTFLASSDSNQKTGNLAAEYQAFQNIAELHREMGQPEEAAAAEQRLADLSQTLKEAGHPVEDDIIRYADFNLTTRFVPDIPTAEDSLNFAPLVKALGDMLSDSKTSLPLAIALTAPWGGGKSSLMKQLQKYLMDDSQNAEDRQWQTVWFDAWKYETNEQVWASLAKLIYDHPQKTMNRWERMRFRIHLERQRGRLGRDLVMTSLAVGCGLLAGGIGSHWINNSGAFPVLATGGVLVAIVGFFSRYGTDLWQPFKRAMDRHAELKTKYNERLGFTAEANKDIGHLVKAITTSQSKALVIFVDDLDRCSPKHVGNVVEAINQIFNSAEKRPCAFILGMDRDVVVASIEHEYRHVTEQLKHINPVLANHFGENFLGKIVQATIQIPPPGNTALARLLSSITGNNPPQALAAAQQPFDQQQVEKAVQAFKQAELKNPVDAEKQRDKVEKSLPDIRPEDVDEALRQVRGDLLTSDSKDVATAEFAVLKYLPPNPRTLKRFDNLFRLQLHVTNNTPGCRINFKYEEIEAMARWVALRFRWPDLAKLIDKDPSLLENLDQSVNDDQTPSDEIKKWIDDDYLRGLLSTGQKGTRVSALPFDTFLRVT